MIVGQKDRYQVNQNLKPMMGSQGQVYFGINMNTKEEVAIKLCVLDENEKYFMNLYMEKKQQKVPQQLVNIYEFYQQGQNNQFIIIMEKASHGDLQTFMKQTNYLKQIRNTKQVRLQFLKDIAFGVKELHEMGIIHRDLKPENILVFTHQNQQFTCKICDFGLAKKDDNARTQQIGTPFYMAPELLIGDSTSYTKSVDIWALGCLFYELLSEQTLFNGRAIYDLMKSITQSTNSEIEQRINNGLKDCGIQNMDKLIVKMVKKESIDRIDIKEVITEIYSFKGIQIAKQQEKPNNQPNQEAPLPQGNATGSIIKIKLIDKSEQIKDDSDKKQLEIQQIQQKQSNLIDLNNVITIQKLEQNQQIEEEQISQMETETCDDVPQNVEENCKQFYHNGIQSESQPKQQQQEGKQNLMQQEEIQKIQNVNDDLKFYNYDCDEKTKDIFILNDTIKENINQEVIQKTFKDQHSQRLESYLKRISKIDQLEERQIKEQVKQNVLSDLKWKLDKFQWNI